MTLNGEGGADFGSEGRGRHGGGMGAPRNGSDAAPIMLTPSFGGRRILGDRLGGRDGGGGVIEAATTWRAPRALIKDKETAINRASLSASGTLVSPAAYVRILISEHCQTDELAAETAKRLSRAAQMVSEIPKGGAVAVIRALLGVLCVAFADEEGLIGEARGAAGGKSAEAFLALLEAAAWQGRGGRRGSTASRGATGSSGGWLTPTPPPLSGGVSGKADRGSGGCSSCSGGGGTSARPGPPSITAFRYAIHLQKPGECGEEVGSTLTFWCLDPSSSMRVTARRGVLCILLASGMLSPMGAMEAELGLPFPVRVENPHVIIPRAFFRWSSRWAPVAVPSTAPSPPAPRLAT